MHTKAVPLPSLGPNIETSFCFFGAVGSGWCFFPFGGVHVPLCLPVYLKKQDNQFFLLDCHLMGCVFFFWVIRLIKYVLFGREWELGTCGCLFCFQVGPRHGREKVCKIRGLPCGICHVARWDWQQHGWQFPRLKKITIFWKTHAFSQGFPNVFLSWKKTPRFFTHFPKKPMASYWSSTLCHKNSSALTLVFGEGTQKDAIPSGSYLLPNPLWLQWQKQVRRGRGCKSNPIINKTTKKGHNWCGANSLLCDPANERGQDGHWAIPPAIMVQWKNGISPRFSFLSNGRRQFSTEPWTP